MNIENLKELAKDVDIYISQHAIYVNNLAKAFYKNKDFKPVDCHSCAFGKDYDKLIRNHIEDYPEDIKTLLKEIDDLHCKFHELSQNILNEKDNKEKVDEIRDLSTHLFQKLLQLKHTVERDLAKENQIEK